MQKLLPPFLFLMFIIAMGLICWSLGFDHHVSYPANLTGLPFIIMGIFISVTAKKLFINLETNVMTFEEPGKLVTHGIFKYSRNPMYLGFVVALFGFYLVLGAAISSLVLLAIFIAITDRWYIQFEEQKMHHKFGTEYEAYCANVRRWI